MPRRKAGGESEDDEVYTATVEQVRQSPFHSPDRVALRQRRLRQLRGGH